MINKEQTGIFKPNKWIAGVLGFIFHWLGLLYVSRPKWAIFYFLLETTIYIVWLILVFHFQIEWFKFFPFTYVLAVVCTVHAFIVASKTDGIIDRPWYSRWYGLVTIPLTILCCTFLFRSFLFEPFRIPSGSMDPMIKTGSYIVVSKLGFRNNGSFGVTILKKPATNKLLRGDVVVFDYPENESTKYVQRIIGLPGDSIKYTNKRLFINGEQIKSKVITNGTEFEIVEEDLDNNVYQVKNTNYRPPHDIEVTVPEGHYFTMGDNRDDSRDGRYWGFLPAENLVGKVIYILAAPNSDGDS